MTQKSLLHWLLLSIPTALGLVLGFVINRNDVFRLYELAITLATLSILVGIITSILLIISRLFLIWHKNKQSQIARQMGEESEENRLNFLKRLDHELKNPVTALSFGLSNLATSTDENEKTLALGSVKAQADRLTSLVDDIRKLANLDTVVLDREQIDLDSLLVEVRDLINDHPEASNRNINLSIQHAPWPLPKISADWDLLSLAIYNLIENAIKFTNPNDSIEIRARDGAGTVIVEVADTGPGIDQSEILYVWEDLYRGSRTRSISGNGLGLSLVKAIVEKHGGSVFLVSQAGRGSAFSISVPVHPPDVTVL